MPISATISITKNADKPPLEFVARVEDNFEIESVRYDVFGSEDHMPYEPVFRSERFFFFPSEKSFAEFYQ